MILGGEDVAARPCDLSTERSQSLYQDSSLNGCDTLRRYLVSPRNLR